MPGTKACRSVVPPSLQRKALPLVLEGITVSGRSCSPQENSGVAVPIPALKSLQPMAFLSGKGKEGWVPSLFFTISVLL